MTALVRVGFEPVSTEVKGEGMTGTPTFLTLTGITKPMFYLKARGLGQMRIGVEPWERGCIYNEHVVYCILCDL